MKQPLKVLHLIDTLEVGGAENVLVLLVNGLTKAGITTSVCATRHGGLLAKRLDPTIDLLVLDRKSRFDFIAIARLIKFIHLNEIDIIHAHSYSLFIGVITSLFPPFPKLIWHDHRGSNGPRSNFWHFLFIRRCSAIICVKQELMEWAINILKYPSNKVHYLNNPLNLNHEAKSDLNQCFQGEKGHRIVCVANFRPQKDHFTLIRALHIVIKTIDDAHLFLVGSITDKFYYRDLCAEIERLNLTKHISILGERGDIFNILSNCDIGVLSSEQEGLPLALLEYGDCNLGVVTTRVGEIPRIITHGVNGLLSNPKDPETLAACLISYLLNPVIRNEQAKKFHEYVLENHSSENIITKLLEIYVSI